MWIFLNNAFFSIVEDSMNPDRFVVRARHAGDIEKIFNVSQVKTTPSNDYRFRVHLPKDKVISVLTAEMAKINYTNFKDSIHKNDHSRKSAYNKVWTAMYNWQMDNYDDSSWWVEEYYEKKGYKYKGRGQHISTLADYEKSKT